MATDYAEKERQFVDALHADTGKSLADWMLAITDAKLTNRNDIIDWLRHNGFQFARASWLERIHHNGGRLIYGDDSGRDGQKATPPTPDATRPSTSAMRADEPLPTAQHAAPTSDNVMPFRLPASKPPAIDPDIVALLGQAKGLRPLAELVVREILVSVPASRPIASSPLIVFETVKPFAALWPQPKKLRLYGDFPPSDGNDGVKGADTALKSPPPFARMIALDDARQIDRRLRELIIQALARSLG